MHIYVFAIFVMRMYSEKLIEYICIDVIAICFIEMYFLECVAMCFRINKDILYKCISWNLGMHQNKMLILKKSFYYNAKIDCNKFC